ncbi:MAG: protein translocase subunit SecF [Microbacteriaceae bacterium]
MANRLTRFGNELYTGERSIDFVGKRRLWYVIILVLVGISLAFPIVRGLNFSIEFRGGSQFVIANVADPNPQIAKDAVSSVSDQVVTRVTIVGDDGVRVQTDQLSSTESQEVVDALAEGYDVPSTEVTASFIGPSWGADVTRQALVGIVTFLALAALGMALYFRTWKMSVAAIVALIADLVITVGVYAVVGLEVSPAAMIGVLTILAYSLYDTVVVFDKIRENTSGFSSDSSRTFGEQVNLAVNQTLVRSINTSVVAALPVGAILFIGSFALGADTLRDISLALFIGIIVGTWSTVFLAAPMYAQLRETEAPIRKANDRILADRLKGATEV